MTMFKRMMIAVIIVLFLGLISIVFMPSDPISSEQISALVFEDRLVSGIIGQTRMDKYWAGISNPPGLVRLSMGEEGWVSEDFPIGEFRGITGPDPQGRLYCLELSSENDGCIYNGVNVKVFDTENQTVVDNIPIPYSSWYLAISPDGSKLYAAADEWPAPGDDRCAPQPENTDLTQEHPDMGLVVEIDVATHAITRTVNVGTFPHSIYYAPMASGDRILVSTGQTKWLINEDHEFGGAMSRTNILDIIDVSTFTRLENRIAVPSRICFADWPSDPSLVSIGIFSVISIYGGPDYLFDTIWLIDPASGTVADTIKVDNGEGTPFVGVANLTPSHFPPYYLYVSVGDPIYSEPPPPDNWLIKIDKDTGEFIENIDLGDPNLTFSNVFEDSKGRLFISAGILPQAHIPVYSKIIIIEPENHPPVCSLEVVTPMPYKGPRPANIKFDATASYDPDPGDTLSYAWDFDGDGIYKEPIDDAFTGDPSAPTHAYRDTYIGSVNLKVSDPQNAESICTEWVQVTIQ
jgi:hypothetical protein